ncbi:MAG TPA: Gfo/Idh/MocA family oxidoreductase [Micavibrio sp.]
MKILVVGAGSIGKRHATNAAALGHETGIFDLNPQAAQVSNITTFSSLSNALDWKPDGAVIATPHKTHIDMARQVTTAGIPVLIEKPISHTLDGVDEFLSSSQKPVYVVCNMRFHPAIKALHENISAIGKIHYARAQYGNYLPNMRPDADYKKLYCAHKNEGGGVILDAIHEIDYLSWLLGAAQSVSTEADKRSDLEIDVEDYAALSLRHETGIRTEIHLDYLQQCKRRGCEIAGSEGTLIWESTGKTPEDCSVRLYSNGKWREVYKEPALDASFMYKDMMNAFIEEIVKPGSHPELLRGTEAIIALRVAMAAHESALTGKRINL